MPEPTRLLPEEAIPTNWYNLVADLPSPPPLPPRHGAADRAGGLGAAAAVHHAAVLRGVCRPGV